MLNSDVSPVLAYCVPRHYQIMEPHVSIIPLTNKHLTYLYRFITESKPLTNSINDEFKLGITKSRLKKLEEQPQVLVLQH